MQYKYFRLKSISDRLVHIGLRARIACFCFVLILLTDTVFLFAPERFNFIFPETNRRLFASERSADNLDGISDKILRLHIIADNDSEEAQSVKLLVRDAVCEYLSPLPEGINNKEQICAYLNSHLPDLVTIADTVLRQSGCAYRSSASISRRFFPLKTYGTYTFPPGEYDALCITLGKGQGQNWWCLAFPSLCLLDGTYAVTDSDSEQQLKILLTDEEYEAILIQEPKIRFRFRLFEWLKGKNK